MTVVVLLGAPGAGKGTQAPMLADRLGVPHVATGDLFRAAVRDGTPTRPRGRRLSWTAASSSPTSITVRMLLDRLGRRDAADGAVLDGFPRTAPRPSALDEALDRPRRAGRPGVASTSRPRSSSAACPAAGSAARPVTSTTSRPPAPHGRASATSTAASCTSATTTGSRPSARAWPSSSGRSATSSSYYREPGILGTVDGRGSIDAVVTARSSPPSRPAGGA